MTGGREQRIQYYMNKKKVRIADNLIKSLEEARAMENKFQKTSRMSDLELINQYSAIIKELKSRDIIRTKNVTGELGEKLVVENYNKRKDLPDLKLVPASTQHVDAISSNKKRYAIKTITGKTTGVFYGLPSPKSKNLPVKIFDYLVIVKLDENFEVSKILELEWNEFLKHKKWHKTMQAWNISVTSALLSNCKVIT